MDADLSQIMERKLKVDILFFIFQTYWWIEHGS